MKTEQVSKEKQNLQTEKRIQSRIEDMKEPLQKGDIINKDIVVGNRVDFSEGNVRINDMVVDIDNMNEDIKNNDVVFIPVIEIEYNGLNRTILLNKGFKSKKKANDIIDRTTYNKLPFYLNSSDEVIFYTDSGANKPIKNKIISTVENMELSNIMTDKDSILELSTIFGLMFMLLIFSVLTIYMPATVSFLEFMLSLSIVPVVFGTFLFSGSNLNKYFQNNRWRGFIDTSIKFDDLSISDTEDKVEKVISVEVKSDPNKLSLHARDIDAVWEFKKHSSGELSTEGKELLNKIPEDGKECVVQITNQVSDKWVSNCGNWSIKQDKHDSKYI